MATAACLLFSAAAFAQVPAKFGIKGGLNLATLKLQEEEPRDTRIGFHGGLLAHIHLAPQWAVQPELVYSSQGMEEATTGVNNKWKLNYVNVPVMIQYMFNNGFRLQAGPQVGLLTSAKITGEDGGEVNNTDDFKKTDVSVGFGVGYLSYSGLGVDARYNLGLTNINEYDPSNKVTNRVFQLGIFYMFDSRHKAKSR